MPLITPAAIERARRDAQASGKPPAEVLEEQSGLSAEDFVRALAATLGFEAASMAQMNDLAPAFDLLPYTEALARGCVLLRSPAQGLVLVFGDPFNAALRPWAEERIAHPLHWALAHASEVSAYLARHGETMRAMDTVLDEAVRDESARGRLEELSLRSISEHESPVVRLVHSTLYDALKAGASDIHLETTASQLVIKYRLDGVLSMVGTASGLEMAEQVISRIKVMAELDIAERRVPQDGRFKVLAQGREIDFRVSIMPSIFGEDAVLRILDKQSLTDHVKGLNLEALGFDPAARGSLRRLSAEPYGMLLVTGPTGSGKTTTLYAAISEINHGFDKLITIEDPVEYQLPGVLQIPVNEKKGLTFARGLRSILRHDPDKIMVGEIRDPETAQIAVQAALTGHLVFTTVHANNVFDVIGRFMHMGVDPYSFVSALNGIAAQRLLRINCTYCVHDVQADAQLLQESGLTPDQVRGWRLRVGSGCGHCRGTGFRGRKAIAEIMLLNDEIRELIVAREPIRRVKEAARRGGTRFLREAALEVVRNGETSLQEINRVTLVG
ncbi:MAG: type II/IV secretion system protein [Burkholderiales bacterium]|nr:type II/IV secretion system protein [Burkholderiales bacterium]